MDPTPPAVLLLEAMEAWPDPIPGASCAWREPQPCRTNGGFASRRLAPEQQPSAEQGAVESLLPLAGPSLAGSIADQLIRTAVYGPVRTVVREGSGREACPYPNYFPCVVSVIRVRDSGAESNMHCSEHIVRMAKKSLLRHGSFRRDSPEWKPFGINFHRFRIALEEYMKLETIAAAFIAQRSPRPYLPMRTTTTLNLPLRPRYRPRPAPVVDIQCDGSDRPATAARKNQRAGSAGADSGETRWSGPCWSRRLSAKSGDH